MASGLHRTRRQSTPNILYITILLFISLSCYLLQQSLSCCPRSIAVLCPPILFYSDPYGLLTFPSVSFTSGTGSKTHPPRITNERRRRMAGIQRPHEAEDSIRLTKDEPSDRYKQNQQEGLNQMDYVSAQLRRLGLFRGSDILHSPEY